MLALAICVAVGGYLTIGFAFWLVRQAIPSAAKETARLAAQQIRQASETASVTGEQFRVAAQQATDPASQERLRLASEAHAKASQNLTQSAELFREVLSGLGAVFQDLGTLSPPIAALCVAVMMFLTAGGIEVANRLIH
jgi:hypothetical protein